MGLAPTEPARSLTEVTWISVLRETDTDGQASGGSDSDSGDWNFTDSEKNSKSLENGTLRPSDLERNKVVRSLALQ